MEPVSIALRPANPTYDEGMAYARFVDIASEGGLRYALGRRFTEIIATGFASPGHDMSYEYAVFAEESGKIVGMASGYTAEQHSRSSDEPLRQAPGNRVLRAISMALLRFFKHMLADHADDDFYVGFLAVDAAHRGKGIGSRLLEFMEERARTLGCRRFTLDVSAKNHGAARLYKRFGLAIESPAPKRSIRTLFIRRMMKEL